MLAMVHPDKAVFMVHGFDADRKTGGNEVRCTLTITPTGGTEYTSDDARIREMCNHLARQLMSKKHPMRMILDGVENAKD